MQHLHYVTDVGGLVSESLRHVADLNSLFIVLVGVTTGLLMAGASGQLLASLMFGNSGIEASVYIVIALMLTGIAMLACLIPAYKATKVDPSDALRHE